MLRTAIRQWPNDCSSARNLHKSYRKAKITIPVLRGIDFTAHRGQFTAMVGQSGSGKSTLLHVLATLDAPDEGEVHFGDQRIDNLAPIKRDRIRNRRVGMIFQFYHLLPELTTLENVLTPIMIAEGIWRYWRTNGPTSNEPKNCSTWSACRTACRTGRGSCREVKCSVRRSPAR